MTEKLSDISPCLYHYTNEQGLKGILESQCLWATHYKFLNDTSEIELAKTKLREILYPSVLKLIKEIIPRYINSQKFIETYGSFEEFARHDTELVLSNLIAPEIYITSFCAESTDKYINENGILSQWRAYGGDGGFAIVLNTQKIFEMLKLELDTFHYERFLLGNVIYSEDDENCQSQVSELIPLISNLLEEIYGRKLQGQGKPETNEKTVKISSLSAQFMANYKHRGFKEECEARIVAMLIDATKDEIKNFKDYNSKPEKERKFRNKNGVQVPYIDLFHSLDRKLPIEKIIVGPNKDKELRAAALRIMLRNTDINVTVSEIPYIN